MMYLFCTPLSESDVAYGRLFELYNGKTGRQ